MAEDHHFLTSLYVHNAFAVRDLEIPISKEGERRHLILTGPNGSGKSAILRGLANPGTARTWEAHATALTRTERAAASVPSAKEQYEAQARAYRSTLEALSQQAVVAARGAEPLGPIRILLTAKRVWQPMPTTGASALALGPAATEDLSRMFLQYLVNERMGQSLAREDGDAETADRIGRWFDDLQVKLRHIFDDEALALHFDRKNFRFSLVYGGGRRVGFEQLPDGLASVLQLWSSVMLAVEAVDDRRGVVLIDEPELHLHARLQEIILPFLTEAFPTLQFIVATHSPAVITSIPNATVFDLRRREAVPSEELEGIRYGTLLVEHFGIETDFDLATTRKLRRLKVLWDAQPRPGSDEHDELLRLANELRDRPHLLVARVLRDLEPSTNDAVGDD